MTITTNKYKVLIILLFSSIASNAQKENSISSEPVPIVSADDSIKTVAPDLGTDYPNAYENALKRKDELTNKKKNLNDSIKIWNKELKQLEARHASIVKSNEKIKEKLTQTKNKEQKSNAPELQKEKEQLLAEILAKEGEKKQLESQLQEIDSTLNDKKSQRDNLRKIKEDVSKQIIAENQAYLSKLYSEMNLTELNLIKSKCQKYTADAKVNEFVSEIDVTIKNKDLYDNIVVVVNSAYKKFDVDRALAIITQIKGGNSLQQQEVNELKNQLTLFPDGLAAFKEFITQLNDKRNGVDYSMDYFQTDSKLILSKNDLESRIENQLKRVPYLNKKYEEFMKTFEAAPNIHSNVETEILSQ